MCPPSSISQKPEAKCHRIDASELWCWRRLLRISWTTRRSNQSILKEINLEEGREPLPDHAGESPLLSRSGGEKELRDWKRAARVHRGAHLPSNTPAFRMDWLDVLAVQGTLKSLLQHHSSKASIPRHPVFFFGPAFTEVHDYWMLGAGALG